MCVCLCYSVTCLCIHFICFEQGLKRHQIPNTKMAGWAGLGVIVPACLATESRARVTSSSGGYCRYSTVPDELDLGGATAIHVPGTLGVCR